MSWVTRVGRFLTFSWKSGTTGVQGINEVSAQTAVEEALLKMKGSFPELEQAKNAKVVYSLSFIGLVLSLLM
jgi:hypothetical protein